MDQRSENQREKKVTNQTKHKPLKPLKPKSKIAHPKNDPKFAAKKEDIEATFINYDIEPENSSNPKSWRIFCGSLLFEMIGSMPQTAEFVSFKSYQKLRKLRRFEGCLRVQEFIKLKEFTSILDQVETEGASKG